MGIFLFHLRFNCVIRYFSISCLMRGCSFKTDTWEDNLQRTDTWCFSRSCLVKGHLMFFWNRWLREHVLFWKSITQHTMGDTVALVYLPGLLWASSLMTLFPWFTLLSSLILTCIDFIEKSTLKNFCWCSSGGFLLLWQTNAPWQSLIVSSGLSTCC